MPQHPKQASRLQQQPSLGCFCGALKGALSSIRIPTSEVSLGNTPRPNSWKGPVKETKSQLIPKAILSPNFSTTLCFILSTAVGNEFKILEPEIYLPGCYGNLQTWSEPQAVILGTQGKGGKRGRRLRLQTGNPAQSFVQPGYLLVFHSSIKLLTQNKHARWRTA